MSEHWERIIEYELRFYQNYPILEAEIQQKLLENELDIQIATTHIDECGNLTKHCQSVETQAIKRVTIRDNLQKQLDRANKRINRLLNAISKLSEREQEIIDYLYFTDSPYLTLGRIASVLGYRNIQELYKARDSALKSVLSIYESEREQSEIEYKIERDKWRQEMAKQIQISS